jgi:hypothetical protein
MVKKAIEKHPDADKVKLIISNKASFSGSFIDNGKLSLTGNDKFYILGNNLKLVKKVLDLPLSNIIGHYTKYRQDFLDKEAFQFIPDIRKLGIQDIMEDELYELLGLTATEIEQIKGTICKQQGKQERKQEMKQESNEEMKQESNEEMKQERKQVENLNILNCQELIQLCKERKIKGYSKLKKQEIINLLSQENRVEIKDHSEVNLNNLTCKELIQLCKERNIKGYSKLKKQEIIDLLS